MPRNVKQIPANVTNVREFQQMLTNFKIQIPKSFQVEYFRLMSCCCRFSFFLKEDDAPSDI